MLRRIEFACAAAFLAAVVVLVSIASVSRAVGSPIIWSVEIAQLIFLWLCILSIDLAMQDERHFGLQVILDNVPANARKVIEVVNTVVLICFLLFLMPYAWRNMVLMHSRLDGALQIPGSLFHASMVVGFGLLIRTMVSRLLKIFNAKALV